MPARHKGLQAICFQTSRFNLTALVDERGCRRDIRSNGWIEFSFLENRSGRRNKFSSFGADQLLRNFTRPRFARVRSGPDVFADALVPPAGNVPGVFKFQSYIVRTAHGLQAMGFSCVGRSAFLLQADALRRQGLRRAKAGRPPKPWRRRTVASHSLSIHGATPQRTLRQWLSFRETPG